MLVVFPCKNMRDGSTETRPCFCKTQIFDKSQTFTSSYVCMVCVCPAVSLIPVDLLLCVPRHKNKRNVLKMGRERIMNGDVWAEKAKWGEGGNWGNWMEEWQRGKTVWDWL